MSKKSLKSPHQILEMVSFGSLIQIKPDFILGHPELGIEYHLSESTFDLLFKLKAIDTDNGEAEEE